MQKSISLIVLFVMTAVLLVCSLVVPMFVKVDKTQDYDYWQQKCDSFAVQNANLSKGQIVFVGDSITDLYPLDDYYADLPKATYNRGIAGDTTDGVLERMKVSLFDLQPSKIVLMIGINDINSGNVDNLASNYEQILTQIKQNLPSAQVYCMSILPLGEKILDYVQLDIDEKNNIVKSFNTQIQSLVAQKGYVYLDLFHSVCDSNDRLVGDYTDDGIHLNTNGFAVWTGLVKPYLM